jgi:phospholipid-binding lipoprotein MlaA
MRRGVFWILVLSTALAGCANSPLGTLAKSNDPFEPFNRAMYQFNDTLDRNVLKPVASAYVEVTPKPARRGVTNFFANLEDAWSTVNNFLQGKGTDGFESLARVGVNTVAGFFGLFDVASPLGLERHTEDFGQTLGSWGVGAGAYVVLPLLGPTTLRDTAALSVDWPGDLVTGVSDITTRNSLYALRGINTRANYLKATDLVDESALDPYSFVRDSFLQRRRSLVLDGNVPPTQDPDEAPPDEERYDLPQTPASR